MGTGEFFAATSSAMVLVSSVCQILGFFSPSWGCSLDGSTTCQMRGLFFTCPESDNCHPDVPDEDILGLAATSFSLNIPCLIAIIWVSKKQLEKKGKVYWQKSRTVATVFYLFGEFLTGIAAILVYIRYDRLGWSSVLFCTAGIIVFWTVAAIASLSVCAICGAASSKD